MFGIYYVCDQKKQQHIFVLWVFWSNKVLFCFSQIGNNSVTVVFFFLIVLALKT